MQLNHIRRILSTSEPGVTSDKSADACKGRAQWLVCRWIMSVEEVTKPKYLFFYSSREFLLVLMRRNHTQAGAARVCVSPMPRELAAAQSQGKLRLSSGSELLKQSSADKPRILSSRERARA